MLIKLVVKLVFKLIKTCQKTCQKHVFFSHFLMIFDDFLNSLRKFLISIFSTNNEVSIFSVNQVIFDHFWSFFDVLLQR